MPRGSAPIILEDLQAKTFEDIDKAYLVSFDFKMKTEPTRKRSLSVKELRTLRDYPVEEWQEQYRDIFILMFYLIGINAVDLLNAPRRALRNGRLEYIRAKTHKSYSIKVEPEAMEIIEKYYGETHLLNIMDNRSNYKAWDTATTPSPTSRSAMTTRRWTEPTGRLSTS